MVLIALDLCAGTLVNILDFTLLGFGKVAFNAAVMEAYSTHTRLRLGVTLTATVAQYVSGYHA